MANTCLAALNKPIGRSLAERNLEDEALRILKSASQGKCQIHLPQDVMVGRELTPHPLSLRTALVEDVAADEMILDLGPLIRELLELFDFCHRVCPIDGQVEFLNGGEVGPGWLDGRAGPLDRRRAWQRQAWWRGRRRAWRRRA